MYIIYNTVTNQIVGYSPDYLACEDPLMCKSVPLLSAPIRFFNFEIGEGGKIEQTLHPVWADNAIVAEDCLDVGGWKYPYYCSVYASDENMARRRVVEMLKETNDE